MKPKTFFFETPCSKNTRSVICIYYYIQITKLNSYYRPTNTHSHSFILMELLTLVLLSMLGLIEDDIFSYAVLSIFINTGRSADLYSILNRTYARMA